MRSSFWLAWCLAVYVPHLLEEYFTRMYDDPIVVAAFGPIASLDPRQATYAVFQVMLVASLVMAYLVTRGGRWLSAVLAVFAVSLLCESHHIIRALGSFQYNSGLFTSLPMPVLGAIIIGSLAKTASPTTARS